MPFTTVVFHVLCKGRNSERKEVLAEAIRVDVHARLAEDERSIAIHVNCPHNTGGHGQRCKASHPAGIDKIGKGVHCAYSLDLPYAMDIAKF